MFYRILRDSLLRQKRRKIIVLSAVSLGTAAAAALADISLDVGDKMSGELKAFGANLVLLPRGGGEAVVVGGEDVSALRVPSYLKASDLPKVKDNFWKNNILAFAPMLDVSARVGDQTVLLRGAWFERSIPVPDEPATAASLAGLRVLNPYWSVRGQWPDDRVRGGTGSSASGDAEPGINTHAPPEVLVGRSLAEGLRLEPGAPLNIDVSGRRIVTRVAGILSAGDENDRAILMTLEDAWRTTGLDGEVSRITVRALTTPESAVYERLGTDPRRLPAAEFERWTCTPFPSSIAYELERAVPGSEARIVRRIADSEGTILRRTSGLMALIALMAALGSALTVTSALTTSVLERRSEIGLLKAMGAGNARVVALFVAEAAAVGLTGGVIGSIAGAFMARWISESVFGSAVTIRPLSFPVAIAAALLITIAGCLVPIRRILQFRPFQVLRGL